MCKSTRSEACPSIDSSTSILLRALIHTENVVAKLYSHHLAVVYLIGNIVPSAFGHFSRLKVDRR